jgi:hypothetical protein
LKRPKRLQVSMERLTNRSSQRLIGAIIQELNAINNAIHYAKFYSRSHDAVIRVYDSAGNVIKTHEHVGDFKEW